MDSGVKIIDARNSKERDGFWEAYRGCAEENRVQPDRSPFYNINGVWSQRAVAQRFFPQYFLRA